jgi:hypothetical protein
MERIRFKVFGAAKIHFMFLLGHATVWSSTQIRFGETYYFLGDTYSEHAGRMILQNNTTHYQPNTI